MECKEILRIAEDFKRLFCISMKHWKVELWSGESGELSSKEIHYHRW